MTQIVGRHLPHCSAQILGNGEAPLPIAIRMVVPRSIDDAVRIALNYRELPIALTIELIVEELENYLRIRADVPGDRRAEVIFFPRQAVISGRALNYAVHAILQLFPS